MEAGADKDKADNRGVTALQAASQLGHAEIARLLVEDGADKDLAAHDGRTALMMATGWGHVEIA